MRPNPFVDQRASRYVIGEGAINPAIDSLLTRTGHVAGAQRKNASLSALP
jgi:hypothetical protein